MNKKHTIKEARHKRSEKAAALAALGSGAISLREALRTPPAPLLRCDLYEVMMATAGIGRERARKLCERAQVWPHTQLEQLTLPERERIVALLD